MGSVIKYALKDGAQCSAGWSSFTEFSLRFPAGFSPAQLLISLIGWLPVKTQSITGRKGIQLFPMQAASVFIQKMHSDVCMQKLVHVKVFPLRYLCQCYCVIGFTSSGYINNDRLYQSKILYFHRVKVSEAIIMRVQDIITYLRLFLCFFNLNFFDIQTFIYYYIVCIEHKYTNKHNLKNRQLLIVPLPKAVAVSSLVPSSLLCACAPVPSLVSHVP